MCCFLLLTRYWGILTVPEFLCVNRPQIITWGGWILILHLNYVRRVTGYTVPPDLLFLFERTHNYLVDKQGLLPWWLCCLCCLGESNVRSASLMRVINNGKISWVLWSQCLRNPPPPTSKKSNTFFFLKRREKNLKERDLRFCFWGLLKRDIDEFRLNWEYSQYWLPLPSAAGGPAGSARNCHVNKTAHTITTDKLVI